MGPWKGRLYCSMSVLFNAECVQNKYMCVHKKTCTTCREKPFFFTRAAIQRLLLFMTASVVAELPHDEITYPFLTSTVQPLKFRKEYVISSHTLLSVWSLHWACDCPELSEMTVVQPYFLAEFARQTCIWKIRTTNVLLRQTAAHCTPYAPLILRGNLQSSCYVQLISVDDLNDLTSTVFSLIIWLVNSAPPGQNGHRFVNDVYGCIFVNE